jgi:hypothetical protein
MAGIFGGHIFEGFGQVDKAAASSGKDLATSDKTAYIPGAPAEAAYIPQAPTVAPSPYDPTVAPYAMAPAQSNNTLLYVAGGALALGAIAYVVMGHGRGKVTANRRARRRR